MILKYTKIVKDIGLMVALSLAWAWMLAANSADLKNPARFTGNCNNYLTHYYDRMNSMYFGGRLLPACVKLVPKLLETGYEATIEQAEPGSNYLIKIDDRFSQLTSSSCLSVLHEMCHAKTGLDGPDIHSPSWKSCMRLLALEGAFDELW
jgi:hypothetical protein